MHQLCARAICGVQVPVVLATIEEHPALAPKDGNEVLDGYFDPQACTIYIRAGQSDSQQANTLVHEYAHAFLYLSGLGKVLEMVSGKSGDDFELLEEALVMLATPHLVALYTEIRFGSDRL